MKINRKFPVVIAGIAALLVLWVAVGFEGNELPYLTIEELQETGTSESAKRFRLGGNVQEGSVVRAEENPLDLSFNLSQGGETLPVRYHKIVPDMFKEGGEVIVEGYYVDGEFRADNLMTKCASRYEGDLREAESSG
ncbi:MAG: cytochrome c maturation protein CcmE [Candidatus Neomarinimicrobiota bacterium]